MTLSGCTSIKPPDTAMFVTLPPLVMRISPGAKRDTTGIWCGRMPISPLGVGRTNSSTSSLRMTRSGVVISRLILLILFCHPERSEGSRWSITEILRRQTHKNDRLKKLLHLLNAAFHVKCLLGLVVVLTIENLAKCLDRLFQRHILTG